MFCSDLDVSDYGPACPQHQLVSELAPSDLGIGSIGGLLEASLSQSGFKQSEDCLSINIQRPQNISAGEKLPVLMWIHGLVDPLSAFLSQSEHSWT
jgi:carboxylesterase type B